LKIHKIILIIFLTGFVIGYQPNIESAAGNESDVIDEDCTCNDLKLYGKVQFVESFGDIKVEVVDSFPDLKVKIVNSFPDKCGEWQIVDSFPDFKVQIVDSFGDIKIKFVESFPGLP